MERRVRKERQKKRRGQGEGDGEKGRGMTVEDERKFCSLVKFVMS